MILMQSGIVCVNLHETVSIFWVWIFGVHHEMQNTSFAKMFELICANNGSE